MTQPQAQQPDLLYVERFKLFLHLVEQIHSDYQGQAWAISKRSGLEDAIAFCETKIQDSRLMGAYWDSVNASNH